MAEWVYAQMDPAEELAQLHYFSFKKRQPEGEIEFVITVKEFASRNALQMRFYAQADKEVNQRTAPFRPFGWGDSLLRALSECMHAIRQNPYDPEVRPIKRGSLRADTWHPGTWHFGTWHFGTWHGSAYSAPTPR